MEKSLIAAAGLSFTLAVGCASAVEPVTDDAADTTQALATCGPSATPAPAIALPADEGPHANQASEWWYYTGHLVNDRGERYGFQVTFFQLPGFNYAQFAVTDAKGATFRHQTTTPTASPAPMTAGRFDLHAGADWSATGTGGDDHIHAAMDDGTAIDLGLRSTKAAALDYHGGLGQFPNGEARVYSRTRMKGGGTLTVGGNEMRVDGDVWFDHQWGAFSLDLGWVWMGLELDGDEELMAVQLRDAHTQDILGSTGNSVVQQCTATELPPNDPRIVPTGSWTSPHTQKTYPSGWQVTVPSRGLDLTLAPVLADQELYNGPVPYWEGEVTIGGTRNGRRVSGRGYVELVGF
jgi:predicted secreted hydrolase